MVGAHTTDSGSAQPDTGVLVKTTPITDPTLTTNQLNLDPTPIPNKPNCSDDPGGSNIIYLTHL